MSAHVFLNLLNKMGGKIRYEAVPSILSIASNELNKYNNTGTRIQDSFYHDYDTKITFNSRLSHQNVKFSP